ncbi:MAG TPA: extracellular solute-binding protein [Chloroflexota bacterium]|nr:extracellular solute-binding protein [Chloroflexota bacterium]
MVTAGQRVWRAGQGGGVSRRSALGAGVGAAGGAAWLAACGGTPDGPPSGGASRLKAGSSVVFWNDMGGPYPGLMQRWGEQFGQQTQVKVEPTGGIGDYANKLAAAFAGGTAPDVFRYLQEGVPLPTAVERNMLRRLDDLLKRDKTDLSDFRKDSLVLYQWKGAQLALPRDYGLQLIYYNTEQFQKEGLAPLPTDWNDKTWTFGKLLEVAQRLARGGERWALFVNRGARPWASWVYSNGGALVKKDADGLATEFALAERPAVEALQFVQDLIYKHRVAPEPAQEAALGDLTQLMQNGKVVMRIGNPSDNQLFRNSGMPYDVGVFPLGPSGTRRGIGGGGTGWAISGGSKAVEESWAFLQHITGKEAQLGEVEIGQTTPSRVSVVTGKEYLDPSKPPRGARVYADGQEYVVRDPVHGRYPDAQRDALNAVLNERFWTGAVTAAQAVKEVKERGDPILKG